MKWWCCRLNSNGFAISWDCFTPIGNAVTWRDPSLSPTAKIFPSFTHLTLVTMSMSSVCINLSTVPVSACHTNTSQPRATPMQLLLPQSSTFKSEENAEDYRLHERCRLIHASVKYSKQLLGLSLEIENQHVVPSWDVLTTLCSFAFHSKNIRCL